MIRQYVGARYVPKFANPIAWTSGTSYEAMTIVTYNNSSYTSKVPVPATIGNPSDNPEYWALTGNYNAQVEAYREETVTIQNNLNAEIQNRENAESTIINNSGNLKNRKFIFIGDSYGVGYDPDDTSAKGWCQLAANYCGLTSGTNVFFNPASGIGFSKDNVAAQLNIDSIEDKNSITDIIVCLGTNDAVQASDTKAKVLAGLNNFMNTAKTLYPNAMVHLGVVSCSTDLSIRRGIPNTVKYYNEVSNYDNGCYILNSEFCIRNSNMLSSDGTHPTTEGYQQIAKYLSSYIKGKGIDVYDYLEVNGIEETIHNNILDIYHYASVSTGGLYPTSWNGLTALGKGYLMDDGLHEFYTYARVTSDTNVVTYYPCAIRITDRNIEYQVKTPEDAVVGNISKVEVFLKMSVPTLQY